MKHLLKLSVIVLLMAGICPGLYSQLFTFQGKGSKAMAMGGAFIGLADDSSALYWNPAGLTQLDEQSLSVYAGTDAIVADLISNYSYKKDTRDAKIDAQSIFTPFTDAAFNLAYVKGSTGKSDKWMYGFAYTYKSLGVEWKDSELKQLTNGTSYEWGSHGAIYTLSGGLAYKCCDKFSLGAAVDVNFWSASLKMPSLPLNQSPDPGQYTEETNGRMIGLTVGMLFKPCKKFSLGGTCKFPLTKWNTKGRATLSNFDTPASGAKRIAKFPWSLGIGGAYKTDRITVTADVDYTNWKTIDTIEIEFDKNEWKNFKSYDLKLDWKNCFQWGVGVEYKLSRWVALRGGYRYDPNPGPETTQNILIPVHEFNFFTGGAHFNILNYMLIDIGFVYGKGKEVVSPQNSSMEGTHTPKKLLVPNITITFYF